MASNLWPRGDEHLSSYIPASVQLLSACGQLWMFKGPTYVLFRNSEPSALNLVKLAYVLFRSSDPSALNLVKVHVACVAIIPFVHFTHFNNLIVMRFEEKRARGS